VDVMERALKQYEPDVVVGSSWGGAIATWCLVAGSWSGPTVLLAPAYHRVRFAMGDPVLEGAIKVSTLAGQGSGEAGLYTSSSDS
jgi:hypothetical protein